MSYVDLKYMERLKNATMPEHNTYVENLDNLLKRFTEKDLEIFGLLVSSGVSEECEAKRLVVDMSIRKHNRCISEDTAWISIKSLVKLGLIETEKISTGFRNFNLLKVTFLGRYLYREVFREEPPKQEHERIYSEHASLEHGYVIKDVGKILQKRGIYSSVTTGRKENRISLCDGRSVIPDVVAIPYNGYCYEYYEVELGTHTHNEFNAKCNKLLKITPNINIIGKNRDRLTRIIVPQIEWWIKEVGIGVLRQLGEKVTVYSIMDLARGKPTYRLDLNTGKMVCYFKPEKEENG